MIIQNRLFVLIGIFIVNTLSVSADVKHVSSEKELEKLIKAGNAVVKFSAEWCGPCKKMKPIFEHVEKNITKRSTNILFIEINTDKIQQYVQKLKIKGIPTLIYFKDGKEVTRTVGAMSAEELQAKIETTLS